MKSVRADSTAIGAAAPLMLGYAEAAERLVLRLMNHIPVTGRTEDGSALFDAADIDSFAKRLGDLVP